MNGVRRFLGGGGNGSQSPKSGTPPPQPAPAPIQTTMPLAFGGKSNWPPMSPGVAPSPAIASSVYSPVSPTSSSEGTPVFFRRGSDAALKALPRVPPPPMPQALAATPPRATPTPPPQSRPPVSRVPVSPERIMNGSSAKLNGNSSKAPPTRQTTPVAAPLLDTRDEMLMSLLASDALVDCRDLQVLSFEEIEELKKEQQVLSSRVEALTKKLTLETKIRDAAMSLQNLNQSHKRMSKPTTEQLDVANRKVDMAQKELYRVSERANDVRRKLLEHRAAVLAFSLRSLEAKNRPSYDPSVSAFSTEASSPVSESSATTAATSLHSHKFDGAHLFAGNSDALFPTLRQPPSIGQVMELEEKLKAANAEAAAAKQKQTELARELSVLQLAKDELETTMSDDLQTLEAELERVRRDGGGSEEMKAQWDEERRRWDDERALMEEEKMDDLARLQEEHEQQRADDLRTLDDYNAARDALQQLVRAHDIIVTAREVTVSGFVNAVSAHLDSVRKDARILGAQRALSASPSAISVNDKDVDSIITALRSIWPMLPSPEARATKIGLKSHSPMRPKSPGSPRSASDAMPSLSDLDVRQLKALYDPRHAFPSPAAMSEFSVDAFVKRVEALLSDDRALIERLIRFAQSHDYLKSNAERAQKLAQESTTGLETYAKQVRALEQRSATLTTRVNELTSEVTRLTEQLRTADVEKRALELTSQRDADLVRSLREANETLTARTLTLAGDPSARAEMETQLAETRKKLKEAEDELLRYQTAQESQRAMLLDEMNELQKNNSTLRDQLRAKNAK
ncbi:hypothetical protein EXIGLDRAFT_835103 [Exidia glandulosa HHB12029]|uniref:Up-regulated during septation protein 1 domain-containing protein n=1 Tax=Exidia glandulosa HHB12029 TaxID=1314781 RepID=A0A165J2A6_EXIGL|nr:hypothetical protein EXIGLDRAFT_835103 [Exidia glandulosa HHB12029]